MKRMLCMLACLAQAAGAPDILVVNDDGAWSWFEDERAIVAGGKLIAGSVAAGSSDAARRGDIEVAVIDVETGRTSLSELHDKLLTNAGAYDDHNSPALLVRPDGRILAVYAMHGPENRFYYRISQKPHDATAWGPERSFTPSAGSRITYSNLHYLSAEKRVYNFYRGLDNSYKPSYAWSDDMGETWTSGNVFLDVPGKFRHRPYVKYVSNGVDAVHIFYTEGHPRDFDNSTYHVVYRGGNLHRSDGTVIRSLREGLKNPAEGTIVFRGDANHVAWVSDIHLDASGRPYAAFSVQRDSAGLPPKQGGADHRYYYAWWTGSRWEVHEIAYAGSRLYAGEDDYTGNVALDPHDPRRAWISANVDPLTGEAVNGAAQRYEIYEGRASEDRRSWTWSAVTANSPADNIRPIVPIWPGNRVALLWLRGRYTAYTDYDLDVLARISRR